MALQAPSLSHGNPSAQPVAAPMSGFFRTKKIALYAIALLAAVGAAYFGVKFGLVALSTVYKFTVYTLNTAWIYLKYTLATTWLYIKWQWNLFHNLFLCAVYSIPFYVLANIAKVAYQEAEAIQG